MRTLQAQSNIPIVHISPWQGLVEPVPNQRSLPPVRPLMSNAQGRREPNVGAVDRRVPRLDPRSSDAVRRGDRLTRRLARRDDVVGARLRVRRGERGHADGHIRVRRDVRAVDPGVRRGDGALLQRELGLDRSAAHASKQLVSGKK